MEVIKIDSTSYKIIFNKQDHTLGNILNYQLSNNDDVLFSGYMVDYHNDYLLINIIIKNNIDIKDVLYKTLYKLYNDISDIQL
jgi:DNA-directed RNA polymerase subunit L